MQAVFGLIKDAACLALHHLGADLLTAVGRQAVQNDRIGCRLLHQGLIHAESRKGLLPLRLFGFLAHGGPNVV